MYPASADCTLTPSSTAVVLSAPVGVVDVDQMLHGIDGVQVVVLPSPPPSLPPSAELTWPTSVDPPPLPERQAPRMSPKPTAAAARRVLTAVSSMARSPVGG